MDEIGVADVAVRRPRRALRGRLALPIAVIGITRFHKQFGGPNMQRGPIWPPRIARRTDNKPDIGDDPSCRFDD
ncbi:hypothetical protein [Burkholderia ubonensis]|uniref:hypothetical protein n=1 Tax=Burkholderia ubonensis TaxID=101571 RepID=UPI0018DFA3F1|nr:hypothetical protein [Burkholderia ubonensis]